MPIQYRRLPGSAATIVEEKSIPQGHCLFNPSAAGDYLSLRGLVATPQAEQNYTMLIHIKTGDNWVAAVPDGVLLPTASMFQGIEDVRLAPPVGEGGRIWFTATCTHASPRMCSELLVGELDTETRSLVGVRVADIGTRPVKNLCPFVHDGRRLLLDVMGRAIFEWPTDAGTGAGDAEGAPLRLEKVLELSVAPGVPLDGFRGSTSPVHLYGNVWGCIVHDTIELDVAKNGIVPRLSYLHAWMEFDIVRGAIVYLSSPFIVAQWGIEFVSGILYHGPERIELFMGLNDKRAARVLTDLNSLRTGKA